MLFTLRPLVLESKGLVAALRQLASKIEETHDQTVVVEADPDIAQGLDMKVQGVAFFISRPPRSRRDLSNGVPRWARSAAARGRAAGAAEARGARPPAQRHDEGRRRPDRSGRPAQPADGSRGRHGNLADPTSSAWSWYRCDLHARSTLWASTDYRMYEPGTFWHVFLAPFSCGCRRS